MLPASVAVSLAAQGAAVAAMALSRRASRALLIALGGGLLFDVAANVIAELGHHNLYMLNVAALFESVLMPVALVFCCRFGKIGIALFPVGLWPIAMWLNGGISAPDRWFSGFVVVWLIAWSGIYLARAVAYGTRFTDIAFVLPSALFIRSAAGAVAMFYFSSLVQNDQKALIVLWDVFNYASAVVIIWIGVSACISAPRSN